MPNEYKGNLLDQLRTRFGKIVLIPGSQSLFKIGDDAARIYVRYSKVHKGGKAFFGLRKVDLRALEGHNSFLCFLQNDGSVPLLIPYADFEEVFRCAQPAADGQYKAILFSQNNVRKLYIARQGHFNVEGYIGFGLLERSMHATRLSDIPTLSHSQVQTLLAGIGHIKGHDVYLPPNDVVKLDWSLANTFTLCKRIPSGFSEIQDIISEVDVLWVSSGGNSIEGLFEVEHSTPVYSGLLRFNDILLTNPSVCNFSIVSNDARRSLFSRQIFRPTFRKSGLSEMVSFLEYANVFDWYARLSGEQRQ